MARDYVAAIPRGGTQQKEYARIDGISAAQREGAQLQPVEGFAWPASLRQLSFEVFFYQAVFGVE